MSPGNLILIAEDSATQAVLLEYTLARNGYRVLTARNGQEALELAVRYRPDVVITDIVMPIIDGFELCSRIKLHPELGSTAVIILTALSDPEDIIRALAANADCFVTKPFQDEYLLSQVSRVLQHRPVSPSPGEGGQKVEVFFAGQTHVITAQRQQILSLLLSTFETAMQRNAELLQAKLELQRLNADLEQRVLDRTAALTAEIVERQRLEEEKARVARSLELILRSVNEGVCGADCDGRITFANEAAARLLGYDRGEDLIGRRVHRVVHQSGADGSAHSESECPFAGCRSLEGIPYSGDDLFWRRDGTPVTVEYSVNPMIESDQIQGIVITFRDITERVRNAEILARRIRRVQELRSVDLAILRREPLDSIFSRVTEMACRELNMDAAAILLLDEEKKLLCMRSATGFRNAQTAVTRPADWSRPDDRLLPNSRILFSSSGEFPRFRGMEEFYRREEFVGCYAVPLLVLNEPIGLLELFTRSDFEPDVEWTQFAEMLAGQVAIAVNGNTLFENLRRSNIELRDAYETTLYGWSRALDLRDKETEGHTQRVTELTVRLARIMGIDEEEIVHIRRGALLHDIGKMGVPDQILLKPGPLTEEEWVLMKLHPVYAYELLSPIAYLRPALDIPYCHHEKWDGTGYPRGLKGEEIPLAARIFAVADIWDAIRSDRPYREAWPVEKALEHIRSLSGSHLDPAVVEAFLQMVRAEEAVLDGSAGS